MGMFGMIIRSQRCMLCSLECMNGEYIKQNTHTQDPPFRGILPKFN